MSDTVRAGERELIEGREHQYEPGTTCWCGQANHILESKYERGRRDGLEQAAQLCEGRSMETGSWFADAIRSLAATSGTPAEHNPARAPHNKFASLWCDACPRPAAPATTPTCSVCGLTQDHTEDCYADDITKLMDEVDAQAAAPATSEYERGRRDEAILWREAIFTGTSSELMTWIMKRWEELSIDAVTSGTPAPRESNEPICPVCWKGLERHLGLHDICPHCGVHIGYEKLTRPLAPPPADETLPAGTVHPTLAAMWKIDAECAEAYANCGPEELRKMAQPSGAQAAPGPKCSHGVLMREFCQGCEDAASEEPK